MNINRASKEELTGLAGIGEKTADAIIRYRSRHGAFQTIEELRHVGNLFEQHVSYLREKVSV
ncbi:MAG: helix-hairpin-helix domain-containing protein [bacterium]